MYFDVTLTKTIFQDAIINLSQVKYCLVWSLAKSFSSFYKTTSPRLMLLMILTMAVLLTDTTVSVCSHSYHC